MGKNAVFTALRLIKFKLQNARLKPKFKPPSTKAANRRKRMAPKIRQDKFSLGRAWLEYLVRGLPLALVCARFVAKFASFWQKPTISRLPV